MDRKTCSFCGCYTLSNRPDCEQCGAPIDNNDHNIKKDIFEETLRYNMHIGYVIDAFGIEHETYTSI